MTAPARLNVDLIYLKEQHFAHRYFELTDSNNIKLLYANENIFGACDGKVDLHANTVTLFVPNGYDGYNKFEFPDLRITCMDFNCDVPNSTRGTLMCDSTIGFESQSSLLDGDILGVVNDSLVLPFREVHDLRILADPASGMLEMFF